ncbi:MAG TPA: condensation domain-containing protein, partial [Pyrinomonadaceae bacterium]|nr:condensation domain-containing protein [Pyrinomonadaceae bacterium]
EEGGGRRLVGYVVAEEGKSAPTPRQLREQMRERLPEHMIPSAFLALDALPLTPNGKVDRRALARAGAELRTEASEWEAPRVGLEEVVAGVFASVLKAERVGRADNFFELGGHSLLATQVVSRLREACGVEIPLRALFEQPTVEGLSRVVEASLRGGDEATFAPPLVRVGREQELPLSFSQQRLWFLDQLEPGSDFYNLHSAVRLSGRLNVGVLEEALSEIVRRHEILRTTFESAGGQPVQVIWKPEPLRVALEDLRGLGEAEMGAEVRRLINEEARAPFDLSAGPLLRVKLLRLAGDEHVVSLTMHHIISDGWSMSVLVGEIAALYQAFEKGEPSPLPELEVQYADYAVWQRGWLSGEVLEAELSYWRTQLGGELPVLELPTDRPRPAVQTYNGAVRSVALPDELSDALRGLSNRHGCTLYMTLLAAFDVLLYRYTGQTDIVVGSPVAGRQRREVEPLIGFFVNTLVLRTDVSGEPSFVELLKRVREVTLGAYAHQNVPFEKLVEELQPERDMSRSPLFQVDFTFQHFAQVDVKEFADVRMAPVGSEGRTAKYDLTLSLARAGRRVSGTLEYNTDLFDHPTARRIAAHFTRLLSACAADPHAPLGSLHILDDSERRLLLSDWPPARRGGRADACVHELFQERAALSPAAPALSFGGRHVSYGELNARANRLAHHLRALGVGPEVRVGLCVERSVEMVV